MTTTPEPIDFTDNRERTNAYIIGLEARNKQLRLDNEVLRDKINNPEFLDSQMETRLREAYRKGWKQGLNNLSHEIQELQRTLRSTGDAAWNYYLKGPTDE